MKSILPLRSNRPPAPSPPLVDPMDGPVERVLKRVFAPQHLPPLKGPIREVIKDRWRRTLRRLLPLGGTSEGNKLTLFDRGDDAFEAMWLAIGEAKHRVWLETYILADDGVGGRFIEALTQAAQRGCDVIFVFDAWGSPSLPADFFDALKKAGGRVVPYNPLWPTKRRLPLLQRNHRKILIVDGHIGFCGGMNLTCDYAGPRHGNGRFRDAHTRVDGPACRDLGMVFLSALEDCGDPLLPKPPECPPPVGDTFVQVLDSNQFRQRRAIQKALRLTIRRATHRVYLTTPYFLPSRPLTRALFAAAERGVDVQILTAGISDVQMMRHAGQHVYGRYLKKGIRIHELGERTLHAKTVTIDGIYGAVGSFNLDRWSSARNLEVHLTTVCTSFADQLEARFLGDLKEAKEVHLAKWSERVLSTRLVDAVAYGLMRL